MYVIWSNGFEHRTDAARTDVATALREAGARGVQINVADAAVAPAASLRITNAAAPPVAMISMWLDTAIDSQRAAVDAAVVAAVSDEPRTLAGYLVSESVPLVNTLHPPATGERTFGFAQIACIPRPPHMAPDEWRAIWQEDHTQLAIDTQSTFGYVQNLVVRPLTPGAPPYAAIVEELFPPAAMTSPHAFFDALDGEETNDERLQHNVATMIESTARFLDVDQIDVFPTSQYIVD